MNKLIVVAMLLFISIISKSEIFKAHNIFTNNMMLQRNKDIPVYGFANSGDTVFVTFNKITKNAITDNSGKWIVEFPALVNGYKLEIIVKCKNEIIKFENILIGDIWFASGQSNMNYTMQKGVKDTDKEIANANYPNIRFYKFGGKYADNPKNDIPVSEWKICTSDNVKTMSAVAYFFAQKVHTDTNVPIGIVETSVGGSSVEAWTSKEAIAKLPHFNGPIGIDDTLKKYTIEQFAVINSQKLSEIDRITGKSFEGIKRGVNTLLFDDSKWNENKLLSIKPSENTVVWLRKVIELPEIYDDSLVLSLGLPVTIINVYINEEEVYSNHDVICKFKVTKNMFVKGKNILTVRLANKGWNTSFTGKDTEFYLSDKSGKKYFTHNELWKYNFKMEPQLPKTISMQHIPHALYNGCVYPLLNLKLTGIIWYQGEQNGDRGLEYQKLFPALINDWRIKFKQNYLPFIYVQLANLSKPNEMVENIGWPFLREAQDMALQLPNTGMSSAIDVGEEFDIHPRDKKPVGVRLALNALKIQYGKDLVAMGPRPDSVQFVNNKVIVYLNNASGLKTIDNQQSKSFCLAGIDKVFYKANVVIDENKLIITCAELEKPVALRYAWAKNPIINLYNSSDLPATPFRTDNW